MNKKITHRIKNNKRALWHYCHPSNDAVALLCLQTPWRRTSTYFKWHPHKYGYPSWHRHVVPIGLTCFTRCPIQSINLSLFFAKHSDIGEGIIRFLKTTPKTRVSYSERSLKSSSFFSEGTNAKQFGMEVVLNMIVLHGPRQQSHENSKNNETWKKNKKKNKKNIFELTHWCNSWHSKRLRWNFFYPQQYS